MSTIRTIMQVAPVIPVVTIERVEDAEPLARALEAGGLPIIEITLRTAAALPAIKAIKAAAPAVHVGAGTIWTGQDLRASIEAGATFGVSPGATPSLLDAVQQAGLPFLPGCQTPSDVADRVERGFDAVKFFPAGPAGGVSALKALSAVFPAIQFCPTGGVSADSASDYLALPNVPVVGGSWLTPGKLIDAGAWDEIEALAASAAALGL